MMYMEDFLEALDSLLGEDNYKLKTGKNGCFIINTSLITDPKNEDSIIPFEESDIEDDEDEDEFLEIAEDLD